MVKPSDAPYLRTAVELASPESLYHRFHAAKVRLTDQEVRYLTDIDLANHVCLVAIRSDGKDHWFGLGAVRCIRLRERPDAADFAIMVTDDFQRQGLGRLLTLRIIEAAQERGIRILCGEILSTNFAMFRLIDQLPYPSDWAYDGRIASFEMDLASPS